ncbi:DUF3553 domain-containing protein [Ferrovibrio sp.]|uniref:DUF3553 domain-containing protein n=1 Tax=Ferrovibrio sp. TaxID=1917215 RepID=UPI003D289395
MPAPFSHNPSHASGSVAPSPFAPGDWVENPAAPDWGLGQVQSAVGPRVTVNFEHAGKQMVNINEVALSLLRQPKD